MHVRDGTCIILNFDQWRDFGVKFVTFIYTKLSKFTLYTNLN